MKFLYHKIIIILNYNITHTMTESKFEKKFLQNTLCIDVYSYLNINSVKNMSELNKNINKNKLDKTYGNFIVKNCSAYVITSFMRKFSIFIKKNKETFNNTRISQKTNALFYFIHYPKRHIDSWFNNTIQWKKDIILSYNPKNIENPTRFDLYNLIKKMNVNDVYSIGW